MAAKADSDWKKIMKTDAPDALDAIDRQLLDIIQSAFPLCRSPYEELGGKLGISGEEALARVRALRQSGLIRRLGANFKSAGLGHVSTLCAARVPADRLEEFIALVNAIPGVTHNYERKHDWNIWFTLIGKSQGEIEDILRDLHGRAGVEIINLPATKLYKIKVDFQMSE